jgi:hypothetical protein
MHDSIERPVPREIESSLRKWGRESAILQTLYISLGIIAIIAPLTVASFTDLLSSLTTRVVSFVGAVAVGLIGGFQLAQKANNLRQAYIDLNAAILRYRADPNTSEKSLIRRICNDFGIAARWEYRWSRGRPTQESRSWASSEMIQPT